MRTPRPYQQECIAAIRKHLDEVSSTVVVMATGTGKTIVSAILASEWPRGNVLFLAERVELLDQAADKLAPELGYRPVVEQAQRGMEMDMLWQGGAVLVGSVQTMRNEKRLEKFRNMPFDLIIVDECHHAVASSYRIIHEFFTKLNPNLKTVGITATPSRSDKKALGVVFNSCAFEYPIVQAIEDGWLTPIRQEIITIENVDFSHIRMAQNEFGEMDFKLEDLQAVLIEEEPLHALARPILDRTGDQSVVVFTAGVPHAHLLAAILNRERPNSAAALDGSMVPGSEERTRVLRGFAERKIKYICNYGILTEGWDCDFVSAVAMGRPTKSRLVYEQMLGRVLRPLNGIVDGYADAADRKMAILRSDKPHALCLDFVGNSRHQLVTVQDVLGGNYDLETLQRAKENAAERKQVSADVLAELRKARAELLLEKEQQARRAIRAQVEYQVQQNDVFGVSGGVHIAPAQNTRGGSSDAQIALLVNLGVSRETATRYAKRQASTVISDLKSKRCTTKQQEILKKFGEDPSVNFAAAKAIIDEIAGNGWRPRSREAS
jgi:superfamily II DNA or RNA helicase